MFAGIFKFIVFVFIIIVALRLIKFIFVLGKNFGEGVSGVRHEKEASGRKKNPDIIELKKDDYKVE